MNLSRGRRITVLVAILSVMLLGLAPTALADHGGDPDATASSPNPPFPEQCGIDVGIALDTSNSIFADSPANPGIMKDAAKAFVTALTGTPSRVSVYSFQTSATLELGLTDVSTDAGAAAVKAAIDGVVFGESSPTGGTNWEDGFAVTLGQGLDALAFATDGNPTTHNGDGDPGFAPGEPEDLEAGIAAANAAKAEGTRVVGIGIGGALNEANLVRVSGPTAGDDYYLPASFAAFEATLDELANRLCAPSVTVQNLVDPDGSGNYEPQAGWTYIADTPVTVVANPADGVTLADGLVNFKLSDPATIAITQVPQAGLTLESISCVLTDGTPLATTPIADGVSITLGETDIAVCEFRNVGGTAGLDVDKVADDQSATVGQTVTYTYTITNTGTLPLTNVTVTDDILGPITLSTTSLDPGATTTGTATYTVTAADLPGPITNVATAGATDPSGGELTATDTETVGLGAFDINKVADANIVEEGDIVTYSYTVTNTGSVTLTDLVVTDDKLGPITLATTTLAAGESTTGTATYTVTAADIGSAITNLASGTATDPEGEPVVGTPDDETVDTAGLTLEKTVDLTSVTVGDIATYTFVITNIGNVPLSNITLSDDKIGPITLPATSLAPGESMTATGTYTVTAADAASPPLVNVGTVTATDPEGNPVTTEDDAEIPTVVLQAATTTTTTIAATTLPKTGGQLEAGPTSSVGAALIMLGGLLVLMAVVRRRQLAAPVRHITDAARDWAQRNLGG